MNIIAFIERHQTEVIAKVLQHCSLWEESTARGPLASAAGVKAWSEEVVFMNSPYGSEIGRSMAKAHAATMHESATVVCLVPAPTDTGWWHKYAMKHEVRLLRGRLKFGDGRNSAPFTSALVVMRPASFALRAWTIKPDADASLSSHEQ